MTDDVNTNEKQFDKTIELSLADVKDLVDEYGVLKLRDVKAGSHFIAKIVAPVECREYQWGGKTNITHKLAVEYSHKELEDKAPFNVQVGERAALRLITKHPNDSYVGKYAFFSNTAFNGLLVQFINPMEKYVDNTKDIFKLKPTAQTVVDKPKPSFPAAKSTAQPEAFILSSIEQVRIKEIIGRLGEAVTQEQMIVELVTKHAIPEIRAVSIAKYLYA